MGAVANNNNGQKSTDETTPLVANAREAFIFKDAHASRQYHEKKLSAKDDDDDEAHQSEGGFLKPIIFGGLDGILTSFAIVAGAAGGRLPPSVVLILGFSNIFADALSMGVGEFLSSKATNEWILSERGREEWELDNFPEGEIQEMVDIYISKGMSPEDAESVIRTMSKYKKFFVDLMMAQELELQVPEEDHIVQSCKEGFVMFTAFASFGAMPLIGYVLFPLIDPDMSEEALFLSACIVTAIVLFLMGSLKSYFCTQNWFRAGTETLILGGTCATVAYMIGQLVQGIVGEDA